MRHRARLWLSLSIVLGAMLHVPCSAAKVVKPILLQAERDPGPEEQDEETIELRPGITVYSALYDAEDNLTRIFADAELHIMDRVKNCAYVLEDSYIYNASSSEMVPAKTTWLPDPNRRLSEGWMVECEGPSLPTKFVWVIGYGLKPLRRLRITPIVTRSDVKFAVCGGPFYTHRSGTRNWVQYYRELGVAEFFFYAAPAWQNTGRTWYYGIHPTDDLKANKTLTVFPNLGLTWLLYNPPPKRFYLGQYTINNECLYRTRRSAQYIIFMDVDEFIFLPDPKTTLESIVNSVLPHDVASVKWPILEYPVQCQPGCSALTKDTTPASAEYILHHLQKCHSYKGEDHYVKSKVIVRPNNTRLMAVHTIEDSIRPGLKHDVLMPKELAYVKHFRNKGDTECKDLLDDRNISDHDRNVQRIDHDVSGNERNVNREAASSPKRVMLRSVRRGDERSSRPPVLGLPTAGGDGVRKQGERGLHRWQP